MLVEDNFDEARNGAWCCCACEIVLTADKLKGLARTQNMRSNVERPVREASGLLELKQTVHTSLNNIKILRIV